MSRINKPGNGSETALWPGDFQQFSDLLKETHQVHEESPWIIAQSGNVINYSLHTLEEFLKTVALTDPSSEPQPVSEQFELLISPCYELTRPIPIHIFRYEDGSVLINSMELNLYAEGHSEYEARKEFSEVLIYQLEDLHGFLEQGEKLGVDLQTQLRLLERFIREVSSD